MGINNTPPTTAKAVGLMIAVGLLRDVHAVHARRSPIGRRQETCAVTRYLHWVANGGAEKILPAFVALDQEKQIGQLAIAL